MASVTFLRQIIFAVGGAVVLFAALALVVLDVSSAQTLRPERCEDRSAGLVSIEFINEADELDNRPLSRIQGGGFDAMIIVNCRPAHWQWRVLEHPGNATSTPQVISYHGPINQGFGTHLIQNGGRDDNYVERVPAELFGDSPGQFYHKYKFTFDNAMTNIGPITLGTATGHPSLDADIAYQFELVFFENPPPGAGMPVTGQAKAYTLHLPPYMDNGIVERIERATNVNRIGMKLAENTGNLAQSSACNTFEDGAAVYSDNCEPQLSGTGFTTRSGPDSSISPLTTNHRRIFDIKVVKKPPGANRCWTAGADVPIEVTFSAPVAPVVGDLPALRSATGDAKARLAREMDRPVPAELFLSLDYPGDGNVQLTSGSGFRRAEYDPRSGPIVGRFQQTLMFRYTVEREHQTEDTDTVTPHPDPIKLRSPSLPGGYLQWDSTNPVAIVDINGEEVELLPHELPSELTMNTYACVDGDGGPRDMYANSLTFNGILQGTPAELTYRRLIVARGWTVAFNLMIVFMSIVLAWIGLTTIVNQHIGRQSVYSWRETIPRFILSMVAGATSWWWCRLLIDLSDALSRYVGAALDVQAGDIIAIGWTALNFTATAGVAGAAARGGAAVATGAAGGGFTAAGVGAAWGFVALMIVYYAFALLVLMQFIIRIVLINILMMFAPLAMTLWALPQTSGWGRRWLQMWLVTLAQHALQLFGLALALYYIRNTVPDSGGGNPDDFIWGLILSIAALYITYKIPSMLGTGGLMEGFTQTLFYVTSIAGTAMSFGAGRGVGQILMQRAPVGSVPYSIGQSMMRASGMGADAERIHKGRTTP